MNKAIYNIGKLVRRDGMSSNPDDTWNLIKGHENVVSIVPIDPNKVPVTPDKVRFVCVSDTHNKTNSLMYPIPEGDVLLHAGDFTYEGSPLEVRHFNAWLGTLPHRQKIVIAGNHDLTMDDRYGSKGFDPTDFLSNATAYLNGSETTIYGIKIFGSPWTPTYRVRMAFNLNRGRELREKWNAVPDGTDILMTHGPPLGRGDLTYNRSRAGCVDLLETVKRVKPKFHVFGHIHEGYGTYADDHTCYINAALCNISYRSTHKAIVFDMPIPHGFTKEGAS